MPTHKFMTIEASESAPGAHIVRLFNPQTGSPLAMGIASQEEIDDLKKRIRASERDAKRWAKGL